MDETNTAEAPHEVAETDELVEDELLVEEMIDDGSAVY